MQIDRKANQFIKLNKNVKYVDIIKTQLDQMGLIIVKLLEEEGGDEVHMNLFFKIFAKNLDDASLDKSGDSPHVKLWMKLVT